MTFRRDPGVADYTLVRVHQKVDLQSSRVRVGAHIIHPDRSLDGELLNQVAMVVPGLLSRPGTFARVVFLLECSTNRAPYTRNESRQLLETQAQRTRSLLSRREATMAMISGISSGFLNDMTSWCIYGGIWMAI